MKPLALLFILSFLAVSCVDDSSTTTCSVDNPVEDLPWLATRIQEIEDSSLGEYFYVTKASYGVMTVFLIKNCCPMCSSYVPVLDCSGVEIGQYGAGASGSIDPSAISNEVVIWIADDNQCNFEALGL